MPHKELALMLCGASAVGILNAGVTGSPGCSPWSVSQGKLPAWGTYTSCVAPQPTALEAEISPSVQREFLA